MQIQLSDKFSYGKLIRFTLPSIAMMVFTSIYSIVDGFFVSNFVDKEAFTAVNFIFPFIMILGAIGFMFGTGGSAYISKKLGEGKSDDARRTFTMLIYVSFILGIVAAVLGIFLLRPVASLMGATGEMLEDCVVYGTVILLSLPFFIMQNAFQSLFITAEKPKLGFLATLGAGITNMVLDALFVGILRWGLVGAAAATSLACTVGGIAPLIYFAKKRSSILYFVPAAPDFKALLRITVNGSSEFLANISMSVVGMLYNTQLMHYAGNDGVAAYGVLMYVNFIFIAVFIGYAIGVAPIVGYHYGAGNKRELRSILFKSIVIISITSVLMFVIAETFAVPLSAIFVGYDKALLDMTVRAFYISSFSFIFAGLAIFSSSFFTALSDGITSAILSFLRTLVFQTSMVIFLPPIIESMALPFAIPLDGIWVSVPISELLALLVGLVFLVLYRHRFGYAKSDAVDSDELCEVKNEL